jgi:hypothetical protein
MGKSCELPTIAPITLILVLVPQLKHEFTLVSVNHDAL